MTSAGCRRAPATKQNVGPRKTNVMPKKSSLNPLLKCKHGHTAKGIRSRTYKAWAHMIQRCTDPNAKGWENYGGRGIRVCTRWRNSFKAFLEDMGECPLDLEIDRWPNKNGYYEPGNCRWATDAEQARNRRNNRMILFLGKTQCLSDWAEQFGLSKQVLHQRLSRGWTVERAFTQKIDSSCWKHS